jgi:dethiobiotin synthetase
VAAVFVTGTDTGCGKTFVSECLIRGAVTLGLKATGMKPVAAGVIPETGENEDVVKLAAASTPTPEHSLLNQYCYPEPCSPNIASELNGSEISLDRIQIAFEKLRDQYDLVVVEAVGGWKVPLGKAISVADLAVKLNIPVVFVVGVRLGCINHALLTAESLHNSNVNVCGWVANLYDDTILFPGRVKNTLLSNMNYPLLQVFNRNEPMKAGKALAEVLLDALGGKSASKL